MVKATQYTGTMYSALIGVGFWAYPVPAAIRRTGAEDELVFDFAEGRDSYNVCISLGTGNGLWTTRSGESGELLGDVYTKGSNLLFFGRWVSSTEDYITILELTPKGKH